MAESFLKFWIPLRVEEPSHWRPNDWVWKPTRAI